MKHAIDILMERRYQLTKLIREQEEMSQQYGVGGPTTDQMKALDCIVKAISILEKSVKSE